MNEEIDNLKNWLGLMQSISFKITTCEFRIVSNTIISLGIVDRTTEAF